MFSDLAELEPAVTGPPTDWRQVALGDVVSIVAEGISAADLAVLPEVHHYSLPAFDERAGPEVGPGHSIKSNKTVVPDDCVLFSKLNPRIPRIWRVRGDAPSHSYCSTEFWPLVAQGRDVDLDYLAHYLSSAAFLGHPDITPSSSTNSHQRVDRKAFERFKFAIPPLEEQRRIADVLRAMDEAIASADLALTQARMVRRSAISELLSPTSGPSEPDRVSCRLGDVLTIAHGFAFKSKYFTSNRDDPILLTPGNFSVEKTLYFGNRTKHYSGPVPDGYVLEDGSLVVVMTDLTQDMAILGNAVEISGDGVVLHNQRIGRVSLLRSDLISKGYARLLLNSDHVQSRIKATASGSTVRHTAPSRILECEVQLPPLDEQARIVAIAKSLDDIVIAEERRRSDDEVTGPLSHLRGLKDMIARDLLSGRVRVPG